MIGGKSLGGRMASLVADEAGARGLVCLGYPFHPPGQPDRLRTAHLARPADPDPDRPGDARPLRHPRGGGRLRALPGDPRRLDGGRRPLLQAARRLGAHGAAEPGGGGGGGAGVRGRIVLSSAPVPSPAHLGHLAALGTAVCWAFSALAFAAAGRRIGVLPLNLIRLVMALGFLCLAAWALRGLPLPVDASPRAWGWLGVSGLVGFVFGDLCLFRSYVLIGPRISSLMMSLAPLLTALIGWLVLGETLTGRDALGMALTVAGIAWAVLERPPLRS